MSLFDRMDTCDHTMWLCSLQFVARMLFLDIRDYLGIDAPLSLDQTRLFI